VQSQSNDIPEHRHPELEQRIRLLHQVMVNGFEDVIREVQDGFGRVNARLDAHDQRFDAIEERLSTIEAHLRRINPNGQANP